MESSKKFEILKNALVEKRVNFLLGAGASSPFFSSLGNIENVLTRTELTVEGKNLIKCLFYHESILNNQYLIDYLHNSMKSNVDYEPMIDILENYKHFIHSLIELMKLRNSRIAPKRTNIVTTNYDIFLETAIEGILQDNPRVFFNDGGSGYINRVLSTANFNKTVLYSGVFDNYSNEMPVINLIKCHGSINWKERNYHHSRDRILIDTQFNEVEDINHLFQENWTRIDKKIYEIDGDNLNNRIEGTEDIKEELDQNYNNGLIEDINHIGIEVKELIEEIVETIENMQIVYPTKRKFERTLIQEHYFNMLRFLSYELEKEQSVLIVFGFSFYDEHITEVIERCFNNPSLFVFIFCYQEGEKEKIIEQFSFNDMNIPNNIIFIQPEDFKLKKLTVEEFENKKDYLEKCTKIEVGDEVILYDARINVKQNNTGDSQESIPTIDFSTFNKVLDEDLSKNQYVNNNEVTKGGDDE